MNKRSTFLVIVLGLLLQVFVVGQNKPIIVQADSGIAGSRFIIGTDGEVRYIATDSTAGGGNPISNNRVITYNVHFNDTGTYDLFVRLLVNTGAYNDDSYFYGNGFGTKNPKSNSDWIQCNMLASGGYTGLNDVVDGAGGAQQSTWKWLNMSLYTAGGGLPPVTFRVNRAGLDTTFMVGGREDGLYLDKFAFGRHGYYYTVKNLNNIEAGSATPPVIDTVGPPLAEGLSKFLGCVYDNSQALNFKGYWNQLTPGNAGKWGSVEGTRDVMNWTALDAAYNYAKTNNMPFRMHTLIWGNQQPTWIESLDSAEQRQEIEEWFAAVAARYDSIDMIDVVNEPLHDAPYGAGNGNYIKALSSDTTANYNWIVEAFRIARKYFPTTKLMLNEYSVTNETSNMQKYVSIVNLLKAQDTLLDGVGIQAHAFSTSSASVGTQTANLNLLAATGLPIYITEMDIDGPDDITQVREYMRIFPMFWADTAVKGVTLWGYRTGTWRPTAYLIDDQGNERPAMTWLRQYLDGTYKPLTTITVSTVGDTSAVDTIGGTLQLNASVLPADATFKDVLWSVSPSSIASISSTGLLTSKTKGTVTVTAKAIDYESPASGSIQINIGLANGTNQLQNSDFISVYPNPVSDGNFRISGIDNVTNIVIVDLVGKKIKEFSNLNQNSIDIQLDANPGIYLIQLSDGQNTTFRKLIIN